MTAVGVLGGGRVGVPLRARTSGSVQMPPAGCWRFNRGLLCAKGAAALGGFFQPQRPER